MTNCMLCMTPCFDELCGRCEAKKMAAYAWLHSPVVAESKAKLHADSSYPNPSNESWAWKAINSIDAADAFLKDYETRRNEARKQDV